MKSILGRPSLPSLLTQYRASADAEENPRDLASSQEEVWKTRLEYAQQKDTAKIHWAATQRACMHAVHSLSSRDCRRDLVFRAVL
jgi:hypothetical protein